jgi:hypothetical protein
MAKRKRIPVKSAKSARAAKSTSTRPVRKTAPRPAARKSTTRKKTPAPGEGMEALDRVIEDLEGGGLPPKPTGRR